MYCSFPTLRKFNLSQVLVNSIKCEKNCSMWTDRRRTNVTVLIVSFRSGFARNPSTILLTVPSRMYFITDFMRLLRGETEVLFTTDQLPLLKAAPCFWRLVAVFSSWRPGIDHGTVHVGFVVEKLTLEQAFPRVLWVSLSVPFH